MSACEHCEDGDPCGCLWCTLLDTGCFVLEEVKATLKPTRLELVDDFVKLLTDMSVSNTWHGGVLHIQMDDGNLTFDSEIVEGQTEWYGRTLTDDDHRLAKVWDSLSLPERAVAAWTWQHRSP